MICRQFVGTSWRKFMSKHVARAQASKAGIYKMVELPVSANISVTFL